MLGPGVGFFAPGGGRALAQLPDFPLWIIQFIGQGLGVSDDDLAAGTCQFGKLTCQFGNIVLGGGQHFVAELTELVEAGISQVEHVGHAALGGGAFEPVHVGDGGDHVFVHGLFALAELLEELVCSGVDRKGVQGVGVSV